MTFSTRGQVAGEDGKGALLWEVMPSIQNPKNNPDRYFGLGLSNDALMHDEHFKEGFALCMRLSCIAMT